MRIRTSFDGVEQIMLSSPNRAQGRRGYNEATLTDWLYPIFQSTDLVLPSRRTHYPLKQTFHDGTKRECPLRRVDCDRDVAERRFNISFGLKHKIEDAAHHDGYVWVELLKSMLIWNKLEAGFPSKKMKLPSCTMSQEEWFRQPGKRSCEPHD
jgi:hypothetical protein